MQADNWQANVVLWPAAAMEEKDGDRPSKGAKAAAEPDEDPDNGPASSSEEATDTDGALPYNASRKALQRGCAWGHSFGAWEWVCLGCVTLCYVLRAQGKRRRSSSQRAPPSSCAAAPSRPARITRRHPATKAPLAEVRPLLQPN